MKFQMDGGIAYDFEEEKEDQEDIDYKQLAGMLNLAILKSKKRASAVRKTKPKLSICCLLSYSSTHPPSNNLQLLLGILPGCTFDKSVIWQRLLMYLSNGNSSSIVSPCTLKGVSNRGDSLISLQAAIGWTLPSESARGTSIMRRTSTSGTPSRLVPPERQAPACPRCPTCRTSSSSTPIASSSCSRSSTPMSYSTMSARKRSLRGQRCLVSTAAKLDAFMSCHGNHIHHYSAPTPMLSEMIRIIGENFAVRIFYIYFGTRMVVLPNIT